MASPEKLLQILCFAVETVTERLDKLHDCNQTKRSGKVIIQHKKRCSHFLYKQK